MAPTAHPHVGSRPGSASGNANFHRLRQAVPDKFCETSNLDKIAVFFLLFHGLHGKIEGDKPFFRLPLSQALLPLDCRRAVWLGAQYFGHAEGSRDRRHGLAEMASSKARRQ